jgi:hypothetical protein
MHHYLRKGTKKRIDSYLININIHEKTIMKRRDNTLKKPQIITKNALLAGISSNDFLTDWFVQDQPKRLNKLFKNNSTPRYQVYDKYGESKGFL